jgi:hypothetical protein
MSIEKTNTIDQIEVVANGSVQVRTKTVITENGQIISQSLHRHVVCPGDEYSNEDARVQAICAVAHTPEVIEAYKAAIAAQGV